MGTTLSDGAAEVRANSTTTTTDNSSEIDPTIAAKAATRGISEAQVLFEREVDALSKDIQVLASEWHVTLFEFIRPAPDAFLVMRDMVKLSTRFVRVLRGYAGSASEILRANRDLVKDVRDEAGALTREEIKASIDILSKKKKPVVLDAAAE